MQRDDSILTTEHLNFYYGDNQALYDISISIPKNRVTALIGPSGCGKSTLLRCFDRLSDLVENVRIEGRILFGTRNIRDPDCDVVDLRKRIGMVFQKPNPFPSSIYDNIAYGPRVHGVRNRDTLDGIVQESLKKAALWDEVADRLNNSAMGLSGGQQQRLCIARTLAVEPEIILMDEPCSSLDPIATSKIESLINTLKEHYTVVIVTHNMQQAARVSDFVGFMYLGRLVEFGPTTRIFENPQEELTNNYVTGRFG
ncbi:MULTISPECIES: phosphate ABC transporter ATP-binding protein PstB [unclassified Methanoculleus]|jgi:phosphate transport system ATP-binding protein|uniref:phosphate ABC transporter ATP-binding protein PstB n=1 Tax=unclassified Methanoculleus TaxID=2619537 RepID=UPI0025DC3B65|nr:phosphate ABC transporter ATP-binding protein PstB [Methanoculleus sp. UBA377]